MKRKWLYTLRQLTYHNHLHKLLYQSKNKTDQIQMHFRLSCRSDMQHWQLSCRCIRKNVSCPIVLYVFSTFSMYWKYASKSATLWNHAQTFTKLFQNFSYFELSSLGFSITVFAFEMFCIRCLCDGSEWHSL